jgi:hypothetical protein
MPIREAFTMPRKKKQNPVERQQETSIVSSTLELAEALGMPSAPAPSFSEFPNHIYLYVCTWCGWWTISQGIAEMFGSFKTKPGPRTEPCERCHEGPMYLVRREDILRVAGEPELARKRREREVMEQVYRTAHEKALEEYRKEHEE